MPSASRSAVSTISLSRSTRLATSGTDVAGDWSHSRNPGFIYRKRFPSHRITARSITFCNSRMLPGHSYAWNRSKVFVNVSNLFTSFLGVTIDQVSDQ